MLIDDESLSKRRAAVFQSSRTLANGSVIGVEGYDVLPIAFISRLTYQT